jgi:hypothetical protein
VIEEGRREATTNKKFHINLLDFCAEIEFSLPSRLHANVKSVFVPFFRLFFFRHAKSWMKNYTHEKFLAIFHEIKKFFSLRVARFVCFEREKCFSSSSSGRAAVAESTAVDGESISRGVKASQIAQRADWPIRLLWKALWQRICVWKMFSELIRAKARTASRVGLNWRRLRAGFCASSVIKFSEIHLEKSSITIETSVNVKHFRTFRFSTLQRPTKQENLILLFNTSGRPRSPHLSSFFHKTWTSRVKDDEIVSLRGEQIISTLRAGKHKKLTIPSQRFNLNQISWRKLPRLQIEKIFHEFVNPHKLVTLMETALKRRGGWKRGRKSRRKFSALSQAERVKVALNVMAITQRFQAETPAMWGSRFTQRLG